MNGLTWASRWCEACQITFAGSETCPVCGGAGSRPAHVVQRPASTAAAGVPVVAETSPPPPQAIQAGRTFLPDRDGLAVLFAFSHGRLTAFEAALYLKVKPSELLLLHARVSGYGRELAARDKPDALPDDEAQRVVTVGGGR